MSISIIGGGAAGPAISSDMDKEAVHQTNSRFWDSKGNEVLGAIALPYYGAYITEESRKLFGDITGKRLLEIGCGSGESLCYLGEQAAVELWGMDISEQQIEKTKQVLAARGLSATLICSPMEAECGIPVDYFDIVYSVYAVGWTTDLEGTFRRIASYLKRGGSFIFSWSHPIHKCVAMDGGAFAFKKRYFDESWYSVTLGESTLTLCDRMLSTYINALAKAGFAIEQMIERSDETLLRNDDSDFAEKARMLPVTFVIKARKL